MIIINSLNDSKGICHVNYLRVLLIKNVAYIVGIEKGGMRYM